MQMHIYTLSLLFIAELAVVVVVVRGIWGDSGAGIYQTIIYPLTSHPLLCFYVEKIDEYKINQSNEEK